MAALVRATKANYVVHDRITADTSDREDHTFCGVMFPIRAKAVLPVDHIVVTGLSVRGALGPLTVWVTKDEDHDGEISASKRRWRKIYSKTHPESYHRYEELDLSSDPIMLKPGNVRGIYIHSTLQGDGAIVYDNKHQRTSHDDGFVTILPGRAHVSNKAFGNTPIWGWGNAWRDNREFVGRITYGAVYRLWNPCEHLSFGPEFRAGARVLLLCQRHPESPVSKLPDDCVYYVLNMCRWDWFNDDLDGMGRVGRVRRRADRRRARIADEESARAMEEGEGVAMEEEGEGVGGGRVVVRMDEVAVARRTDIRPVDDGAVDRLDSDDDDDMGNDSVSNSDSENSGSNSDESVGYAWGDHVRGNDNMAYDVTNRDYDSPSEDEDDDDDEDNDDEQIGGGFRRIRETHERVRRAAVRERVAIPNDRDANRRVAWVRARARIFQMLRVDGGGGVTSVAATVARVDLAGNADPDEAMDGAGDAVAAAGGDDGGSGVLCGGGLSAVEVGEED